MRLHVDLGDAVDDRPFEMKTRLNDLDKGAVAQQHPALGLIDRVPAPEDHGKQEQADEANDKR